MPTYARFRWNSDSEEDHNHVRWDDLPYHEHSKVSHIAIRVVLTIGRIEFIIGLYVCVRVCV